MDIQGMNESARKTFGPDTVVLVARAKAFGSKDNCIIVNGKKHIACASGIAQSVRGAKVSTHVSAAFMGIRAKTYSVIEWA